MNHAEQNDYAQFRDEIDDMTARLAVAVGESSVGVLAVSAMELVLNAVLCLDEMQALQVTQGLRRMVDHMDEQIVGAAKH